MPFGVPEDCAAYAMSANIDPAGRSIDVAADIRGASPIDGFMHNDRENHLTPAFSDNRFLQALLIWLLALIAIAGFWHWLDIQRPLAPFILIIVGVGLLIWKALPGSRHKDA